MTEALFRETHWGALDWAIVAVYMAVSLGVGLWFRGKSGSLDSFLVAGRNVGLYLGIATLVATELGLVTVMYIGEAGFRGGFSAYFMGVVGLVGTLFIGLTGFVVYRLRAAEVMTLPEYYERRYSRKVRLVGALILALTGILNYGIFLAVDAKFISVLLGFGDGFSLKVVMTVMLAAVLLYTIVGGMVSVIVTDLVQFVVMNVGMLVATWYALRWTGWSALKDAVMAHRGAEGFDPTLSPEFGPAWMLVLFFGAVVGPALWQTSTVRAMCAKDPKVAKKLFLWSGLGGMARSVIPVTWGIAAYAFIVGAPELREAFFPAGGSGGVDASYGLPLFLSRALPSGILGILMAGMLAASMSTHSSYLLAYSSVIASDIAPFFRSSPLSGRGTVRVTRWAILLIGLFILAWGIWYRSDLSIWKYMAFTGIAYFAGVFVVVVGGLYWKRASSTGAVLGLAAGLLSVLSLVPWDRREYPVEVSFRDARGREASARLVLAVTKPEAFRIASPVVQGAVRGVPFRARIPVQGVPAPSLASFRAEGLPEGFALSDLGELSGTPRASGSFPFRVTAELDGLRDARTLVLTVEEGPVAAGGLPTAVAGKPYRAGLSVLGAEGPVSWSAQGPLPPGFRLEGDSIAGEPGATGIHLFTLKAEAGGRSTLRAYTLRVADAEPAVETASLPAAPSGKPYRAVLEAREAEAPLAWTLKGELPEGLSLSDGVLEGEPRERFRWAFLSEGATVQLLTVGLAIAAMVLGSLLFPDKPRR